MDTTELEDAYRALFGLCQQGVTDGFRAPADTAAWTAEQILAHVIAADRLLLAVTAALVEGQDRPGMVRPAYDDATTTVRPALDVLARAAGGLPELLATLRQTARELVLLARRVPEADAVKPVQVRLVEGAAQGGRPRVDGSVPWRGVLATHAQVHLPEHTADLARLCRSSPTRSPRGSG